MEDHQYAIQDAAKHNAGEQPASTTALREDAIATLHTSALLSSRPEAHSAAALTDSVLREFGAGMYDQAKAHPIQLGLEASVGAAISIATKAFVGTRVNAVLMAVGGAVALYEAGKGAMGLADQAAVLGNSNSTSAELALAQQSIRNMGGKTMDFLALSAGGAIGNEGIRLSIAQIPGLPGIGGSMPELSRYAIKDGAISAAYFTAGKGFVPSSVSNLVSRWVGEADLAASQRKPE